MRVLGQMAFWIGFAALFGMLAVDVLDIGHVPTIWFASLALILTGVMWAVATLRPQLGRRRHG